MPRESGFQSHVMRTIERMLPGCVVLKNDANYLQGVPDFVIFYEDRWAMLEFKRASESERQPNQEYWVQRFNSMSYAAFIHPGNEQEVLDDLQLTLRLAR